MEQNNTTTPSTPSAGKGLGIAGLVLGILAAIVSFIPCLGVYALIPGIVGLILSAISMTQASKAGASKGLAIAGLICSIVGCAIAGWQWYALSTAADKFKEELGKIDTASINKAFDQLKEMSDSTQTH